MRRVNGDLYFLLNPATGLIKVGIANDVDDRRRQLEYQGGIALEVLRICPDQAALESELHDAFGEHRQLGEWFLPCDELLDLALGDEAPQAFAARMAERIRSNRDRRAAEQAALYAEEAREKAAARARLREVRAQERRLKAEEARKAQARRRKREEREAARLAEQRAAFEARSREWQSGNAQRLREQMLLRGLDPDRWQQTVAERRRAVRERQRARNAALIGVPAHDR